MLLILAATVIGLGGRPAPMTDPDPAAYGQWLAAKAIDYDGEVVGTRCASATVTSLSWAQGGAPIFRAPPPDEFIDVSVIEHLKVEGCGHVRLANMLMLRLKSGGWRGMGLLDGHSIASPRLEQDALRSAMPALEAGACTPGSPATVQIGEVRFLGRIAGAGWQELWPATACGKAVAVEVTFVHAADGGTDFSISRVGPDGQPLKAGELMHPQP